MKKTIKIYLADLVHNYIQGRDNWMIPLSALLISSYTKAALGNQVEIRIFKFPDRLLEAIKKDIPDIVGLSNYCWNSELNKVILKFVKERNANTITVMGGPNITLVESKMTELLKNDNCDYYVIGAGEDPFKEIVKAVLNAGTAELRPHENEKIHSVWYLDPNTERAVFKPAVFTITDLDKIPSPFQNGMAKEFLADGLIPMIETQRGCPFRCTYCSWDNTAKHVYKYSIERIKSDIEHCRRDSIDERLMINDPNFGLFGDRDLEIARIMRKLKDKHGWPEKVIINWGQSKSDIAFQAAEILKDMTTLRQSSQSLNSEVLSNINRKDISDEEWKKLAAFCKRNGIESFGELILPLPGETLETYLSALRYFFDLDLDCINTNTLMLLDGARISDAQERNRFKLRTGFRLMENCYGIYDSLIAIEYQEMVVATNSFSLNDFYICRQLSWLIQMSWTMRQHDLLLRLLHSCGVNPVDFFIKAISDYKKAPDGVKALFNDFINDMNREFFTSKRNLISFYSSREEMKLLRKGGFKKLNTYYSARILTEHSKEFIDYYESIAHELISKDSLVPAGYKDVISECARFLHQRYINIRDLKQIDAGRSIYKEVVFYYDIALWVKDKMKKPLAEYYYPNGLVYKFFIDEKQGRIIRKYLKSFSGISKEYQLRKMQEPYQGINRKHLIFNIEYSKEQKRDGALKEAHA